ncbi:unnamed protein product [Rotaria socialis]|uniref:Uncharacterized protein n=1 Tax=Rotaria socialis TaxID=392032 RepID=A0A820LK98_9BILA|nr:unnamed protein product [Rotaria socialis]
MSNSEDKGKTGVNSRRACVNPGSKLFIYFKNTCHEQSVYFAEANEREALERAATKVTTLTAWFKLNAKNPDARQYLYHDIPQHFVFERDGTWKHRLQGETSSVEVLRQSQ